jgi:germination protein M
MSRTRKWKRMMAVGVMTLPLVTAGCGLLAGENSQEIDPPQLQYETDTEQGQSSGSEEEAAAGSLTALTVYLKDRGGYVAPVTIMTPQDETEEAGRKALEMLVDGGAYASDLPEGFKGLLPKGTQISGIDLVKDQKLAIVDFSGPFADYNATEERRMLEAVTWTLTGLPDVEQVQIWFEGAPLNEMPVDGYPLNDPLSRAMGINLELGAGVSYGHSMPVTLYFSALSDEGEQYYVPVTRLVERDGERAKAALQQLIEGPSRGVELNGVMTQDIEVEAVTVDGDTATVELNDAAYEQGQPAPAEMLQAVVLSVTENSSASKVQIRVNGMSEVVDTENRSYSEPVERPDRVNALKA